MTVPPNCFAVYTTDNITSGIDDALIGSGVTIRGEGGRIIIEGEYEHAVVHDLTGRPMPLSDLPVGIYIVTVDGISTKVSLH